MTTYNTDTKSYGNIPTTDNQPYAERSAADKAGGSVEFHTDGSSTHKTASKVAQTIDIRAKQLTEIEASASSSSTGPITLRTRGGAGGTAVQAALNPKRFILAINGRETSLQAAMTTGEVVQGPDGQFYDAKGIGDTQPGK